MSTLLQKPVLAEKEIATQKPVYDFFKRIFDIVVSVISLIVLSPVFLVLSIIIKIDDPKGKVFFIHKRVGKNDTELKLFKFRSMVHNAEDIIEELSPEEKEEYFKNFKLENDPRVTKIGKILRKTSLDELPQLFNILIGNLSIVGPRPVLQEETLLYKDKRDLLLSVKPGLTGYWAVNGRNHNRYDDRIKLELYYVRHRSVLLDIKIILKTFIAVFKTEDAC